MSGTLCAHTTAKLDDNALKTKANTSILLLIVMTWEQCKTNTICCMQSAPKRNEPWFDKFGAVQQLHSLARVQHFRGGASDHLCFKVLECCTNISASYVVMHLFTTAMFLDPNSFVTIATNSPASSTLAATAAAAVVVPDPSFFKLFIVRRLQSDRLHRV